MYFEIQWFMMNKCALLLENFWCKKFMMTLFHQEAIIFFIFFQDIAIVTLSIVWCSCIIRCTFFSFCHSIENLEDWNEGTRVPLLVSSCFQTSCGKTFCTKCMIICMCLWNVLLYSHRKSFVWLTCLAFNEPNILCVYSSWSIIFAVFTFIIRVNVIFALYLS